MSVRTQRNSLPLLCMNFKKNLLLEDWYEYFRDDFDDGILAPEWQTDDITVNKTVDESGGVLTIAINNVDAKWNALGNEAPKIYVPLGVIGPCRITTKLNSFNGDPGASCNDCTAAGIHIATEPWTAGCAAVYMHLWERYRYDAGGHDCVKGTACNTGKDCNIDCSSGCPLPYWFRIHIDGDQVITFWWSDDGIVWTQYTHGGNPYTVAGYDIANSYVGIHARNKTGTFCVGNDSCSAEFEYFLIEKYEADRRVEVECLAPIDTRAPTKFYHGRIKQMSTLKRAVDDKTGLFQVADLSITLANEDKHYSKKMASYFLKNQEAILYHAWTEEAEALKIEVIKLIVDDYSLKGPDFIVKLKDITQKYFTKKVPENICIKGNEPGEFPNIHPNHEGRFMPEILGNASLSEDYERPGAVEAVYVDINGGGTRDYLAARGWLRSAIDNANFQVYEENVGLVVATMTAHTDGHSYINYNPVDADASVSFNCYGYSVPVWDSPNDSVENLAYIIEYFLRFLMDIPASLVNAASFVTLAGYYEDMGVEENGYLILQDRVDAMEILRQLLFTGGAKGFMAMDGRFNVARKNICNWEITDIEHHIFEQVELFGSPERQWNLTAAINTVNAQYGFIPWQNLYKFATNVFVDNGYGAPMEDDIFQHQTPWGGRGAGL